MKYKHVSLDFSRHVDEICLCIFKLYVKRKTVLKYHMISGPPCSPIFLSLVFEETQIF